MIILHSTTEFFYKKVMIYLFEIGVFFIDIGPDNAYLYRLNRKVDTFVKGFKFF